MNEQPFDMTEAWNAISDRQDEPKYQILTYLYRIETICQQNWQTMDGVVQSAIIEATEQAREIVRQLPDA